MQWGEAVCAMGKWYEKNIHTYLGLTEQTKNYNTSSRYDCPLTNAKVRDDCSGFTSACLNLFGLSGFLTSSGGFATDSNVGNQLESAGFQKLTYSKESLQPYDIYTHGPQNGARFGHVEICASQNKQWGWGNVHDGLVGPRNKKGVGLPCGWSSGSYTHIWRHNEYMNKSQQEMEQIRQHCESTAGSISSADTNFSNNNTSGVMVSGGAYGSVVAPYKEVTWQPPIQGGEINLSQSMSKMGKIGMVVGVHINQKNLYGRKTPLAQKTEVVSPTDSLE